MKVLATKRTTRIKYLTMLLLALLCYRWWRNVRSASIEVTSDNPISSLSRPKLDFINKRDAQLFEKTSESADFELLGDRLRIFRLLFTRVISKRSTRINAETKAQIEFLSKIDKVLFPWMKPTFESTLAMRTHFRGDGIVICVANRHTSMVIAMIRMIREVHRSKLPVDIFYIGDKDLSKANRKLLGSLTGVKTKNILDYFDNDILELEGYSVKVFALLASSFRNAMLIDADTIFLQSPERIFDHPSFHTHHAVFFRDRSLYSPNDEMIKWFHDVLPKPPSEFSQEFRIFQGKTKHEQESGVVLIDKLHALPGLLAVCSLNVGKYRKVTYKMVFGDKETFWLGFETIQRKYYFYPHLPGTIGVSKLTEDGEYEICSRQILHLDHEKQPLWLNGGISEYKMDVNSPVATMEDWMAEPGRWDLMEHNLACLYTFVKPTRISSEVRNIIKSSGDIFTQEN
jgi:hypothetical protein